MSRIPRHLARSRAIASPVAAILIAFVFLAGPAGAAEPIRNISRSLGYADLAAALSDAHDGDVVEVTGGPHAGNFIIDRRLVLRGIGMPVLDGGGAGTVLTIRAPDTTVEGLEIRGSAVSANPYDLWGEAGIAVHGDRTRLEDIKATGNDWGVIFFGGVGSSIRASDVSNNTRDGIRILGGQGHLVEQNTIDRNLEGVSLTDWYPDREAPVLQSNDPVKLQDYIIKKANAPRAVGHVIRGNVVAGNAFYGIIVTAESNHNTIAENQVHGTGRDRTMDFSQIAAVEAGFAAITGMDVKFSRDVYGSGILLSCLAYDNAVLGNEVEDNFAHGIVLDMSDRTDVGDNAVKTNRAGILVISTNASTIHGNAVSDNSEFGVRIGSEEVFRVASNDNLVTGNELVRNAVNAFDSSGRQLTEPDVAALIANLPLPQAVKDQLLKNPTARAQWIAGWLNTHKPGSNRWDDGLVGNHHDDFDEASEGFVDRDGNGISEVGKPIPGGPSVDHYPLSKAPLER